MLVNLKEASPQVPQVVVIVGLTNISRCEFRKIYNGQFRCYKNMFGNSVKSAIVVIVSVFKIMF